MRNILIPVIALMLMFGFGIQGHVSAAEVTNESTIMDELQERITVTTYDGINPNAYGLTATEALVYIDLTTWYDYYNFQDLSKDGMKQFMNDIVQANYGSYLGASTVHTVVFLGNTAYAWANLSYDNDVSDIMLFYAEDGVATLTPWISVSSSNTNTSNTNTDVGNQNVPPAKPHSVTLTDNGVVLKNNTMIPAALVLKNLAISLQYDSKTGVIKLNQGNVQVSAQVNSKNAYVNGVKKYYTVPPQIIMDKLMLPVQILKDAFKVQVSAEQDSLFDGTKYIKSITVVLGSNSVKLPVNDLYEKYKSYFGKTAWINNTAVTFEDKNGKYVHLDNLIETKITNVQRDDVLGDWLDVTFIYNGRTYTASLDMLDFSFAIDTSSPFTTYHYSQSIWSQIKKNQVSVGMTVSMVYLSWGFYDRHYEDTYSWGTTDMWVYESSTHTQYLYFKDDILSSISSS